MFPTYGENVPCRDPLLVAPPTSAAESEESERSGAPGVSGRAARPPAPSGATVVAAERGGDESPRAHAGTPAPGRRGVTASRARKRKYFPKMCKFYGPECGPQKGPRRRPRVAARNVFQPSGVAREPVCNGPRRPRGAPHYAGHVSAIFYREYRGL